MQLRSIARFLLLLAVAIVAFIAPLELALRLFPGAIPLGLLTEFEPGLRSSIAKQRKLRRLEDTVLIPRDDGGPAERMWIYKPHAEITEPFDEPGIVATVRTDDRGFCNSDPDAYARAERIDVAAIGDSFTWCTNVAPGDAWPEALERRTQLSVYNFGMPGRGLHEYLQTLKALALSKQPRIAIFALYEGNDLRDAVRFHEAKNDSKARRPCPFGSAAACGWHESLKHGLIGRHSYAFNVALAGAWRLAYDRSKKEIDFRYDVRFADGTSTTFNSRNGDLDEVTFARALVRDEVHLDLFDEPLQQLVVLGRSRKFTPIVAYIPSAYTAYRHATTFDDTGVERTLRQFSDEQRAYFAAKAQEIGYRYVDLTPVLQRAAAQFPSTKPLYFRTNVHLTQAGHEVVAEALAPLLSDLAAGGSLEER
jgi:hypothetical protein